MENSMEVPPKSKQRVIIWFSHLISGYITKRIESRFSKRYLHTYSYSQQHYSRYPRGGSNPNVHWWTKNQTVVYTMKHDQPLKGRESCYMLQRGWTLRTLCWVKQASHKKTNTVWFHLSEWSKVVKFIETGSRMVVARGWGKGGRGSYHSVGLEFQICKKKEFRRSIQQQCEYTDYWTAHSRKVKIVNFMLCVFY